MAFAFTDASDAIRSLILLLVIMIWGIAVLVIGLKGGTVERPNRVPQLYGYTVCLVALLTVLTTLPGMVDSLFMLSDPTQETSRFGVGSSLGSFESYKASQQRPQEVRPPGVPPSAPEAPLTEEQLRAQYSALRADQIAANRFEARRSLVRNGILLLLALSLFAGHWRWLRSRAEPLPSA